jgi:hypothetical protein
MRFYLFPKYKTLISDTQADILLVYLVDTINQHYTLFWQKKKTLVLKESFQILPHQLYSINPMSNCQEECCRKWQRRPDPRGCHHDVNWANVPRAKELRLFSKPGTH